MTTEIHRRIFTALSDIFTFVRSQEANKAISSVSVEDLIQEQIKRNGEEALSNEIQYDPYAFDLSKPPPKSQQPFARANFLSGSDVNLPTKMDRLLAMENVVADLVKQVEKIDPDDIRDPVAEADLAGDTITNAEEFEVRGQVEQELA